MSLIDTHIHLDFPVFDDDREAVVSRARSVGVSGFVVPSVAEAHWPRVQQTVSAVANSVAAYGLHPCYLADHGEGVLDRLDQWLQSHPAVGVGECGLDYVGNPPESETRQLALFDGQIQLAVHHGLPLIVHARKAVDQVTQRLRRGGATRGVVHSYSGSWQQACKLIDLGFHLGIGGSISHERAKRLRGIVARLPDDAWVLETDAPDQPAATHRGERNEPAYLIETVDLMAQLRGVSTEQLRAHAQRNATALFGPVVSRA